MPTKSSAACPIPSSCKAWCKHPLTLDALHILTLWSFAVAQPLYNLLGQQAGFFSAQKADALDFWIFTLAISLVFPAALILLKTSLSLIGSPLGKGAHAVIVSALTALIALSFLSPINLPDIVTFALALSAGIGFTVLYTQRQALSQFLTFLSPTILLFPILFLFFSNITPIFLKSDATPQTETAATQALPDDVPPVVMVIWDELPISTLLDNTGAIDAERYPHFAEFSQSATWFKNTYSLGGSTLWAVPAILSGQVPTNGSIHTENEQETNLFTVLKDSHDLTNVMEKYTTLCPAEFCKRGKRKHIKIFIKNIPDYLAIYLHVVMPAGIRAELPDVSNNWGDFSWKSAPTPNTASASNSNTPKPSAQAAPTADAHTHSSQGEDSIHIDKVTTRKGKKKFPGHQWGLFEKFLGRIPAYNASTKPQMNFLHIVFPHVPYNYMTSGKYYRVGSYQYFTTWENMRQIYFDFQRHLLQVGATDTMMGKLIERLKAQGLYDNAMIIILADHGANWSGVGHERRMLNPNDYRDMLRVPMWIKMPHQTTQRIVDKPVRTIDLLPTVAHLLKLPGIQQAPHQQNLQGHDIFATDYPNPKEIKVVDNLGENTYTLATDRDYKTPSFEIRNRFFGTGSHDGIFSYSPPELRSLIQFGQPIPNNATAVSSDWVFELSEPEAYTEVDLTEQYTPTLVEGRITAKNGKPFPEHFVITVNGRVRNAYPYLFKKNGALLLGGLIPESSLKEGKNTIQLFAVQDGKLMELPQR